MTKVTRLTLDQDGALQNRRVHLREISGSLDAPLETVGQDLRSARLKRGDDLATVSRALKIRKDHLEALEEDRLEALPGRTYAVGFVRSYADYLGLDSVQCVERFKAEIAGRADQTTQVKVIEEDEHRRLPQGWMIIAGVVVALLVYGAYHLALSADQMLTQPVTPPPPQVAKAVPKPVRAVPKPPPVQAAQATPPAATNTINAANSPAANTSGAQSPAAPQAGAQTGQTAAGTGAAAGPSSPKTASAATNGLLPSGDGAAAANGTAVPQGEVFGEQNKAARVVLRVRETTKLLVQGPTGVVYINRTLKPGDSYQVPNIVGLTLTTPNAGAVELELDGAPMGPAGKEQQLIDALSLDPQALVDHYNSGRG
jgi:cytoskeleton protein RodZ